MDKFKEAKELTEQENMKIMRRLVRDWHLGPIKAYDNNIGNPKFWNELAKIWNISVKEARRSSCANCEYGKIEPAALEAMEHIKYNKFDKDGGIRVWCEKFDFICHATRVCQAWEDASKEENEYE